MSDGNGDAPAADRATEEAPVAAQAPGGVEAGPAEVAEASEAPAGASEPAASAGSKDGEQEFDFESHRQQAVDQYERLRQRYEDCAWAVHSVLKTALEVDGVRVHTLEARAKTTESFGRKAASPSEADPGRPKYPDPLSDITDLAGVRVITLLLDTVERVNALIEREFVVVEKSTKSGLSEEGDRLGYQSVHYLVRFTATRCGLPEYARFEDLITEVQVRTILQHAWAEIEHDIQYKAVETIPSSVRRRFTSLAGLVEIADREFQAISDEDERTRNDARRLVREGHLDRVEVTGDALKAYLDHKYGPDGRMTAFSYGWMTRILKRLGFESLRQLDECIGSYNDDQISRALHGSRQGQLTRLDDVLAAAMGEVYSQRHPWAQTDWGAGYVARRQSRLKDLGIPLGNYDPRRH